MVSTPTQMGFGDIDSEYAAFVEKFKPKKTTDDCYTPPEIYEVILDYVVERYGIDRSRVVRPFYPGGDYEREEYPDGCTVVDNPPFSILAKIVKYYVEHGVPFFIFAPTLTCISGRSYATKVNHMVCGATVTYDNGAEVNTSFITNLDADGTVLEANPTLRKIIEEKNDEVQKRGKTVLPKYEYPDNVITAAKCSWFAAHSTPYKLNAIDCCFISKLDAMGDKGIFGGGYLLSERAAAERAAAERAAAERAAAERWKLSERELKIVKLIGNQGTQEDKQ